MAASMRDDLNNAGFLINFEKSVWQPNQKLVWLGVLCNIQLMKFFVPESKLHDLDNLLRDCLAAENVGSLSPRRLARVVGKIVSMQRALGFEVRLRTRSMSLCISESFQSEGFGGGASERSKMGSTAFEPDEGQQTIGCDVAFQRSIFVAEATMAAGCCREKVFFRPEEIADYICTDATWDGSLSLSREAKMEVIFWLENMRRLNGRPVRQEVMQAEICFSDASSTDFGGYQVAHANEAIQGRWSEDESTRSSTWRELAAIFRVLQGRGKSLQGKTIRWCTDNQNVVSILNFGSGKRDLQDLALKIADLILNVQSVLVPKWIPRDQNRLADALSKSSDRDDWALSRQNFEQIDKLWGPHTIDRFASERTAQCRRYNAKFAGQGAEAIDAFEQVWTGDNIWLCPPVSQVINVINYCKLQRAHGTIVVPYWPSAYFWPIVCPNGRNTAVFVVDRRKWYMTYISPVGTPDSIFNAEPTFLTLALRLDFSE